MKKRFFSFLLAAVVAFSMCSTGVLAAENGKQQVEYLNDGGYIVTEIQETASRAANSKTGTAKKSRYDSSDNLVWQIILRGEFTYNGSTSTCTESVIAVNIYNSAFVKKSSSATKSGNTAKGSATISQKAAGVTISTKTYNLSLSCDKNGKLS